MLVVRATQWPPLSSVDGMLAEKAHSASLVVVVRREN
jgi:hypothetical protein